MAVALPSRRFVAARSTARAGVSDFAEAAHDIVPLYKSNRR